MSTGRAINARFAEAQSGYTRATGSDFAFQVDPMRRQQTTSEAVARDLDPSVMHLDTEYNDQYCGPSGLIPDSTIKKCFTSPYTGLPCGNQMLSTGEVYNAQNFPHVGVDTQSALPVNGTTGALGESAQEVQRVLVPGTQPGSNEGTRAIYNNDEPRRYEHNPDATFGRRTGAAFPVMGSGRLDGLQRTGNLGATQPALAASLRASQGIIPGSVGDLEQMKEQGVVGLGNRQFVEWHAPECDKKEYCMGQSIRNGPCRQQCTTREIIPGSQPGSNEGTRPVCGTGTGKTIPFNQTGISMIGTSKPLYQTNTVRPQTLGYDQTLAGTAMPAMLNSTATVPTLPAIKSPCTPGKTPSMQTTQAEIQSAMNFGQQLNDTGNADMLKTVSEVARDVVNAKQLHQRTEQAESPESLGDYAQRVAHEAVTRPQINPNAINGIANSNTYNTVQDSSPAYDSGLPVDNVNMQSFSKTSVPASVVTTSRPNSIPGMTRTLTPSNAAVASSGSMNERGFNEPASTAPYPQQYQPSAPAYNPSHSYSAFAHNQAFPSTSRCCTRTTNGCIPPGGCQCGLASSKSRWDATRSTGITETGVEYVKPPHTTFCDAPVARNFLGAQRHQHPYTASTGSYTNVAEMAAAGFCDKALFQTTQMKSNGNGGASYKNLNAYIPAYSGYRRPWPGNYNEKFSSKTGGLVNTQTGEPGKITDEAAASTESGFIDNCKFDTKPFTFVPGERPIGLTETFAPEEGNKVGGGGNAPENPNEFLTTHNDHFRAIYEPQYGKLHKSRNNGVVPPDHINTDGGFNGLLSSSKIKANVTFKPGCGPMANSTTGTRRCTCYDKVNDVWM